MGRRIPLKEVDFIRAIAAPGTKIMMKNFVPMEARLPGGDTWICPQPFLDPEANTVVMGDREYPMHLVHYFERADMAKSKAVVPNYDSFTIGRREPRRMQISVDEIRDLGPVDPNKKSGPRD